jgi:hypothetical protein
MADTKISNLTALAAAPDSGDFVALVDTSASETKKLDAKYLVRDSAGSGAIVTGAYTLTLPATGTAALLGTANVFTANQRVSALLGVNVAPTAGQQLTVLAGSTSTVGLVVNTPASPTANIAEFRNNGTAVMSVGPSSVGIGVAPSVFKFSVEHTSSTVASFVTSSISGATVLIGNTTDTANSVAQIILDASNGDAAGSDYLTIRQNNDLSADIFTQSAAGILSLGSKGVSTSLGIDGANLKIGGTASRGTTAGTKVLHIFDGTAPTGTLTNGCSFYSTSGEMRVMDAAGNATLLSPHDADGRWIYDSVDTVTGKTLRIDMELMMKAINEQFEWDFVREFTTEEAA